MAACDAYFSLLSILFIISCFILISKSNLNDDSDDGILFAAFILKYNRTYGDEPLERAQRFQIFKNTLSRTRKLNADHRDDNDEYKLAANSKPSFHGPPFGVTCYADLTPDEFHTKVLKHSPSLSCADNRRTRRRKRAALKLMPSRIARLPQRIDWRKSKLVNPVRNQGECGACWAFSTVETLETMYGIRTGQLPLISVQQVIDCALDGNFGCLGGDTCMALVWMNSTKSRLVPDNQYPFEHATTWCKLRNATNGFQLSDFTCDDYMNREEIMLDLLANHGPLVVAVDAVMWQDYLGGIIRFHCEANHNHAVQIVGYDLTGPVPYYIVRNSWGTEFGIDGYLYIAVGGNLCGIANEVSALDALI